MPVGVMLILLFSFQGLRCGLL